MAASSASVRLGNWPRQVLLDRDEQVVTRTFCYRGWAGGNLYLTSKRLIWVPHFLVLVPGVLMIARSAVKDVGIERGTLSEIPSRWLMSIQTERDRFFIGFGGFPTKRQRAVTEKWVGIVRQWAPS